MKPYKILRAIAGVCVALAVASCAEDKTYDFGGWGYKTVNFTATNLALDSTVHIPSTSLYWYRLDWNSTTYPLDVYLPYTFNGSEMKYELYHIGTTRTSELWSGGYNDIRVTFIPSDPAEKEARFLMPDGSTFYATADQPSFIWTPDSTLYSNCFNNPEDTYIEAESSYTIGNMDYVNSGRVFLNINPGIKYNRGDDRWYQVDWWQNSSISVNYFNRFTVENLTIASQDTCRSYNYLFPETVFPRSNTITIPYVGYGGEEHVDEFTITDSYYFYACGNNDLLFTFIPQEGEKEMRLMLPDYTTVTLTADNPTYVWHVTIDDINKYDHGWVTAESTYTYKGITYYCTSEARLISIRNIYYDAASGIFRSDFYY